MKLLTYLLMMCAGLAAADQPAKPAPHAIAKQPVKKAPAGLKVPADATEVSPGLYHWTDGAGKGWMYRRTPFGVSRWADDSEDTKQQAIVRQTTAVEQGDSIRFERSTPFGKRTWVRKKNALDETEQKIWAHQQEKTSASGRAEKE